MADKKPSQPAAVGDQRNPDVVATSKSAPMQSGDIAKAVIEQLSDDFPPGALGWVSTIPWTGPQRIDLKLVDWSALKSWAAYNEMDRVEDFATKIKNGWDKPIVTVRVPDDERVRIVDGHHRALAYATLKKPIMAYVGEVPKAKGPWDETHSSQYTGPSIKTSSDNAHSFELNGQTVRVNKQLREALTMDLSPADVQVPGVITQEKPVTKKKKQTRINAKLGPGGSLNIRHMFDGQEKVVTRAGEALLLADMGDEPKPVWIQIAKVGAFRGHPQGPFVIDRATLSDIKRNFDSTTNRSVAIDYEHASEQDPTKGSIPLTGAPANGHITDMELRDGGDTLWGLTNWTEIARNQIKTGAYKFFSPAIRFNSKDRVTGKTIGAMLSSGALTNKPFLDGMAAMAASETIEVTETIAIEVEETEIEVETEAEVTEPSDVEETAAMTDTPDGVTTMADNKDKDALVSLQNTVSELTIRLTAAEAAVEHEKKRADAAETGLRTMRDAANEAVVDDVIARCAERGYTEALKPHLLSMLETNPEGFAAMPGHKPEDPKAKLMSRAVPVERRENPHAVMAEVTGESHSATINRLMKTQGMSYQHAATQANGMRARR